MSTNCPPQLQLSINPNTTSFKRSFEQFGFDLESPVGASAPGGAGASAANSDGRGERNKRARSASSFDSVPSSDISSDTLASASSSGSSAPSQGSVVGAFPTVTLAEPPRLPTPDIQDVVMSDYPSIDPVESTREALQSRERYRLSLQRFNEFDSEIELLRQSPPSTTTTSPSPPTLPPLRHRLMSDDVVLFRRHTPPSVSSPFSSDFFVESPSSRNESDSSQAHAHLPSSSISISETTNSPFDLVFRETQSLPPLSLPGNSSSTSTTLSSSPLSTPAAGFRDRLDTALQGLRSTSPLVPGLEDSDPELRGEEEMRNRADQQGPQEFQVPDENRNLIDERPPTLPPIQTTDDIFHSSNITSRAEPPPSSVHHQSVAPNPPTLPPIPTVSAAAAAATAAGAGDADPADRAWHGRGQLFTERFDDFMGLNRDFGSTMPTRRDGLTHNDGMDHSPLSSPSEGRETASSPRPFSRSAAPVLSSYTASRNPGLSDHPLPSPILRDLHSWMEERRPSGLGGNGRYSNQNAAQTQTDDSSSVSSISTTAATAGTERDASALSSSSAVMGSTTGSESSYTTSPQEDHLNQIMESIRTRSRVEDWAGRSRHRHLPPRVSHTSSPWSNSNAESDILRDLLPWYSGDPSPAVSAGASAAIPNTTPEASRPISTTPAPAPHMMLNPGSENSTVDSYWEPVFTNLPETDFMVTSASRTTTAPLSATEAPAERHWNPTTRQRHQDGSARSLISRFSDRQYATASSQSGTSPTPPESSTPSTYFGMSTPEAPERGINRADGASHRDRRVSDSTGGLWRLLDSPTELSLNFRFDAPSSSISNSIPPASGDTNTNNNNNNNSHPYQATNTARNIDTEGNRSYYGPVMRDSFVPSSQPPPPPTTTLNLDNHQASSAGGGPSLPLHGMSTLSQRLHARDMLMRGAALPMRDQVMIESPATQMPVSSSLSNWNGRPYTAQGALSQPTEASLPQTIGPSAISGSSSSPTLLSNSEHERLNSNSTSNSNSNSNPSSVDATRTDIRLRHRLFRSRSQTRPGSSNSLVTENASEARRRADHEELRRRIFRDQWSSQLDNDNEEHSSSGNDSSENSWEDAIIERALTQHWRSRFATARGQSNTDDVNEASRPYHLPNPVPHSSSLLDRMETSENSIPTPTSQNNHAPPPMPSYPPQAPSLPPPDLGNSFIAAPHTRSNSAQWSSERIFEDSMDTSVPAPMPSETLFGLHNVNDRRSFNSHAHSRPRPVSTTVAIDLRQMRERDQQNERGLHQMMSDDRALHDGHVHWESVQETRLRNRAAELERRITGGGPHLHHPPSFVSRSTMFNYAPRPTPTPTAATAIASGSDIPRSAANEMRGRVPTTDSAGRYTHFDPSSFAAGPFRNTLQHIAQRDQVPRPESSPAREYARHSSSYLLPLPFVEEMDYTPTRMDSAERNRLRAQQPGRDEEAHRDISGSVDTMMRHLQPGNYSSRAIAEEVHAAVHNTDTSLNSDPNANRRPARFVAAMDRYRRARAEAALDDSLQRIREHAALVEDLHGSRTAPPLHRARRMAPRVEDDDDTSTPETTAPRTARAPRRTLRGEAFMLSRMPATSANASFGPAWRRGRPLGDFMRDEDFDSSYENLLSLSMQIGDAKPRATPAEVLSKMQKGLYQEFASEGSDTRCPICLDDYEPTDPVQKLSNCSHWLHEGCLSQWLQTASTCPVCRESVAPSSPSSPISFRASRYRAMPFQLQSLQMPNRRRRADPSPPSSSPQAATPTSARHDEYTTSSPSSPTTTNNPNVTRRRSQGSNGTTQSPNRANPEAAPWRYRRS